MREPSQKKGTGGVCMSGDDLLVFNVNNEEGKLFNFMVLLKNPKPLLLFLNGGIFMT